MGGLLARFGIIGVIVVGGVVFRDYLTGAALDLQVGDCFDAPTTVSDVVEEVAHHPCTDPHTAEVVYVADYPAQDAFPGVDAFDVFTDANCIGAFNSYTGLDFMSAMDYDMGVFYPTEEGWGQGDHEITCYLVRADEAPMTQSMRAAAPSQ